jgi:hypothetical protein
MWVVVAFNIGVVNNDRAKLKQAGMRVQAANAGARM